MVGTEIPHAAAGASWAKVHLTRAVGVLASGTFLGQVAVIASSPILTRVYSTEDIGLLGIFMTIISIVGSASSLKYEMAIPLAQDHSVVRCLVIICFSILVAVSVITGVILYIFWNGVSQWLQISDNWYFILCAPVGILVVGSTEILQNIALLEKRYVLVARSEVSQNIACVAFQLILGLLFVFSGGIIVGQVMGKAVGTASISGGLTHLRNVSVKTTYNDVARVAKLYGDFPIYTAPSTFISQASRQLPTLLIAAFFGPAVVGMYALGQRVLILPLALIGQAMLRMLLSVAPAASREGSLGKLIESVLSVLLKVAIPFLCMLGLIAPELFSLVFGEDWWQSGVYVQWLVPWMIVVFISLPLNVIVRIYGKQKVEFLFQILLAAVRLLALCVGGYVMVDPTATIALFGIVSAIFNGVFMLWLLSLVGIGTRETLMAVARELLLSIPFVLPVLAAKSWGTQEYLMFIPLGTAAFSTLALLLVSLVRIRAQIDRQRAKWPAAQGAGDLARIMHRGWRV